MSMLFTCWLISGVYPRGAGEKPGCKEELFPPAIGPAEYTNYLLLILFHFRNYFVFKKLRLSSLFLFK